MKQDADIYIIGYGYVGQLIAQHALAEGRRVHALSRTASRVIAHDGFIHHVCDIDQAESLQSVPNMSAAQIIYLAPPPSNSLRDSRVERFLAHMSQQHIRPSQVLYFSTTAVYADSNGEWIDENTPAAPQTDRGKRRYDAEEQVRNWCESSACPWIIFRVTGIYGPGKLPLERIRKGMTVLREDLAPASNRIFSQDLARASLFALRNSQPNEIYNLSDNKPTTMTDYFSRIAQLAGLPAPERVDWEQARRTMSPEMISYLVENKRIKSDKLVRYLGFTLQATDLETGLKLSI
ncbi:MAG: SDR family oxidoreductase [Gammaproteobacteria bacterium]|nr:SDR family oxidoreductase [Gammaproteobacteria bacterium]